VIRPRYADIEGVAPAILRKACRTAIERAAPHIQDGVPKDVAARMGLPSRLSEVGVPESGIPLLVEGAMGDACTLVNPREPTEEEFAELYAKAL